MPNRYPPYRSVFDDEFKRTVTLQDAYRILERFVVQYNSRGESSTVALMTDVGVVKNGWSCDPAQLEDFLRCADEVLNRTE